ncbi:FprA family A-type flavoprotein [Fusobacterium necrophorum]|uniref:Flavoprotein n=1 Tax=Fusobacterium necrophorum DJ-2 TaxID=1441737 RepID=A0AB73C0P7_9FUSO|nr:FprA family A-type flavoprotein [Fusobacterium necrophorum]KDE68385.1 flavoprotein [Fusobacterium necrophorum DJ-1]KDE69932.1 flavoprotein [Fusobacterium necrophorum DJ-2]MBR8823352.1 Anaerobic nitric oxide reductase flavorubredoxin [Fusobacterium necrophorum]MCF0162909.1 FprA family A-type flavoprotein [Fusobacterium necrophorum]
MYCCTKVTEDVIWIGINDRKTERFENYLPLDNGVTYNSYLIYDEKTCAIDAVEAGQSGSFYAKLENSLRERELDYLVVNHVEPDHSGAIKELFRIYPNLKIIGNMKTLDMLKAFDENFPVDAFITIKEKDVFDLGKHKLTFYTMPMVHWPESMCTYDMTDKILFSNDAFGSFGALDGGIFDDEVNHEFYEDEMRRYYSNIVGKYGSSVNAIMKKLAGMDIQYICPSHGILWRSDIHKILNLYQKWANLEPEKEGVVIVYGSMYGHTAQMAEILGRELGNRGIHDVIIYDSSRTDHSYIISKIWKYKGLMIGSCAHNNAVYPKIEPLLHKLENYGLKNRYLGIFGTMMWSGGGVRGISEFASKLKGLEVIGEPIEVKGKATSLDIDQLQYLASQMADKLIGERTE